MKQRSWKTTLGGSLSAFGKTLMGVGVVPQLGGTHSAMLTGVALVGFILDAVGGFFAHLWAADQTSVVQMIEKSGGDTQWAKKAEPPNAS